MNKGGADANPSVVGNGYVTGYLIALDSPGAISGNSALLIAQIGTAGGCALPMQLRMEIDRAAEPVIMESDGDSSVLNSALD